jgi:hypothetical protein
MCIICPENRVRYTGTAHVFSNLRHTPNPASSILRHGWIFNPSENPGPIYLLRPVLFSSVPAAR